ncbi:MAG: thioredoxin family protein [Nitrospinae bacterium CG11_big_fil_rev_8_21_14_0_20_45_15]|nr:MAG: thioredoxin family protein [Nitrospinae bacterium CG11_big_fil_rev_8_21_14_0_20_45_15]
MKQTNETPITLEIFSKTDCSLCDIAKEIVDQTSKDFNCNVVLIDIESNPQLYEEYCEKIPVVKINGEQAFVYKVHPITLRKKLEQISSQRRQES